MISQLGLFLFGLAYLGTLFLIAFLGDKGKISKKLLNHPLVFILSLGVYAGTWAIYGAIGFAHEAGYNYLTFYLGLSAAFFLAPILMAPIFRLAKSYQLNSLADLLTFRYRSPMMGKVVTITMIIAITPILAGQFQAVSSSIQYIAYGSSRAELAIVFCALITLFTIMFGAQHFSDKNRQHHGLVAAIAFESLFKLLAMLIIAGFCIYTVFDDHQNMHTWLRNNPTHIEEMYQPLINGNWPSLILIFFTSIFAMPHMYHLAFSENRSLKNIYTASWGLPIYLMLLAICIPPILWAGKKVFGSDQLAFDYVALGISMATDSPWIALLAYLAGVSAASGIIIVSTLALASMSLNHLVLPLLSTPTQGVYLYKWLEWQRYTLIGAIILFSYLFFRVIDNQQTLSQLLVLAYTASVHLFPALFGTLFWKGANRIGVFAGLAAGFGIWLLTFYLPLLIELDPLGLFKVLGIDVGYSGIQLANKDWHFITMSAVVINFMVMFFVSSITPTPEGEAYAADQCSMDLFSRQRFRHMDINNAYEFKIRLTKPLGEKVAEHEVNQALAELKINSNETRPFLLQKLRDRMETNLSRLLGAARAQEILDEHIPISNVDEETEDIYSLEGRLEEYQYRLTGLAAELDNLRRFHRQTLIDLPIGVCAIAHDGEIITWNHNMELLTGLDAQGVTGTYLKNLPGPWANIFQEFQISQDTHWHRKKININEETRWLNLHKADISESASEQALVSNNTGLALLVEDISNVIKLETKLTHSERLASIGRMAAGIAHEIGNPVTGIDCLAQNLHYDIKQSRSLEPDESLETLEEIRLQTKRITGIVQSLMSFSRAGKADRENVPVNLSHCIQESIKLLQLSHKADMVEINNQSDEEHIVLGDEQLLIQVFVNLISNAIDASEAQSEITIRSQRAGSNVLVSVIDSGGGIPDSILETIFEPFVTTKDPGKGTGLGLALVHSIVEDHGGSITISNWTNTSPDGDIQTSGTQVKLKLPEYLS